MVEIKKVTKEMRDKLRTPLPAEAVKPHPTKTYLSSIKAIYVIERLNDVFGIGGWKFTSQIISTEESMIIVKVNFFVPEYGIEHESFGGNDNGGKASKNFDLGDAYKGAVTDALTKIGSYLEIGIDVYKGNKNVPPAEPNKEPSKHNSRPQDSTSNENNDKIKIKADYVGILKNNTAIFPTADQSKYAFKDTWSLAGAKTALEKLKALRDERLSILESEGKEGK